MNNKRNLSITDVLRYLTHIFTLFGITVVMMTVLASLVGADAKEVSTIFSLSNQGLSLTTLLQFLLISALTTTYRFVLFSDGLICRISLTIRTFLMFFLVALTTSLFAVWFGWFPAGMLKAWGYFFACFALCSFVSAYVMAIKTDRENKQMEDALKKLKEEEK